MSYYLIGIDVGGTKTEACLIGLNDLDDVENFRILTRERIPTPRIPGAPNEGLDVFLTHLNRLVDEILKPHSVKRSQIHSIGVGLPGSINPITQVMSQGSVAYLKGVDLVPTFQQALQFSGTILFDNDANCFALAETYLGAGKAWAKENKIPMTQLCLVGVILGTGVGGGLVVNGKLVKGRRGGAGEIGHTTLIESGFPCYCGKFGCAEQYLSGPAFERSYAARTSALEHLKANEVFAKAENNDPLAIAAIEYYRDHLVTFLSNLSNIMDPHVIVLGGGMSSQKKIYPGISERLSKGCFLTENPPAVLQNQCGDSGGVLGAALLGHWRQLESTDL